MPDRVRTFLIERRTISSPVTYRSPSEWKQRGNFLSRSAIDSAGTHVRFRDGRGGLAVAGRRVAARQGGPPLFGQLLQVLVALLAHLDPLRYVPDGGVLCKQKIDRR